MEAHQSPHLSIVIPTLDAAAGLAATLCAVAGAPFPVEVIVADGGSADATRSIAEDHGATVVAAPRGRGAQLAEGAKRASGRWLLFLHADTVPGAGWAEAVATFTADPANRDRWAVFRFALDDRGAAPRFMERAVAWRGRVLGLPYGDQGLLVGRGLYDAVGGYRSLALMEDVDLVRRLGRRRLRVLDVAAVTSAKRYRDGGYLRRPLLNLCCLGLYFLGVSPAVLARIYR
ncbi:MAG: TIGR04283 family arsenosugar biosynthesis glycosyltransferase [Rhodospirillales bacterium]|jgi:rSAM/selenodomain-associated transferase 2|nr:TIGR04283 family arsenosugar biosynthesis glycosyltransferase [Rhodospirillales bacterium]MDP6882520.1 TIGR04283 family arsenosugar biosynthesis glycosyltransferase [Rhodospirillales bacterium]